MCWAQADNRGLLWGVFSCWPSENIILCTEALPDVCLYYAPHSYKPTGRLGSPALT